MSQDVRPFAPLYVQTQVVNGVVTQSGANVASATATAGVASSASTVFPGQIVTDNMFCQVQIANKTSVWIAVCFGQFGNIRAATLADYPVAPGSVAVVTVDPEVSGATVISDGAPAGSTAVIFTRGSGS